jgi:predicted ATP-grasp superfamily ATP-dependent carboligase
MALHREQLAANFRHALPPAGAVYRLLDKKLLGEAARLAGLDTPETWSPQSERDILDLRASGTFPVVIKPRTHVGLVDWKKGQIVRDPLEFVAAYREMRRRGCFAPEVAAMNPSVDWPIVQRYHPLSDEGIYNIVGFVDRSGELFVAQAMWKLLQAPRHLGIGVVFEAAPLDSTLAAGIRRLCEETGFHGIFEAEFLPFDGRMLLIDFNPRYFHGMALPIARGWPLPWLGYLDAIGDLSNLRSTIAAMPPPESTLGRALVFGLELNTILIAQRLTRGLTLDEANRLRRFLPKHRTGVVDGVRDANDPEVWRAHTVRFVARALTRPRTFAGTYALNR